MVRWLVTQGGTHNDRLVEKTLVRLIIQHCVQPDILVQEKAQPGGVRRVETLAEIKDGGRPFPPLPETS